MYEYSSHSSSERIITVCLYPRTQIFMGVSFKPCHLSTWGRTVHYKIYPLGKLLSSTLSWLFSLSTHCMLNCMIMFTLVCRFSLSEGLGIYFESWSPIIFRMYYLQILAHSITRFTASIESNVIMNYQWCGVKIYICVCRGSCQLLPVNILTVVLAG